MSKIKKIFAKIAVVVRYLQFRFCYPRVRYVRPRKVIGTYHSQDGQDLLMSVVLFGYQENIKLSRFIVDIGANHPIKFSNSLFFEKYFGCKTLAVDPLSEFGQLWHTHRPSAEFLSVALGKTEGFINLNVPIGGDSVFSNVDGGVDKKIHKGEYEVRKVEMTTLRHVLAERAVTDVLLLLIDVEGFELDVLQGTDFDKVKFQIILIENNNNGTFGSNDIRTYLLQRGYVYYARIGCLDDMFVSPELMAYIQKNTGSN